MPQVEAESCLRKALKQAAQRFSRTAHRLPLVHILNQKARAHVVPQSGPKNDIGMNDNGDFPFQNGLEAVNYVGLIVWRKSARSVKRHELETLKIKAVECLN